MHSEKHASKTLGSQAAALVTELHERNRKIFRLKDVREIARLSPPSARSFIRSLVARGVVTRLRPGLFILVPYEMGHAREFLGNPLLLAREILEGKDYYLSHGTAMSLHGMLTQPQLAVTVTSPVARRPLTSMGVPFRFVRCQRKHLFGVTAHWATKQDKVRVSDLERTLVDGLKQPEYSGGVSAVAQGLWLRRAEVDVPRLAGYAIRLGVGAVVRRLGYLLEFYGLGTPKDLERLRRGLTGTYARLDPVLPPAGRRLGRWRLQLNIPSEELQALGKT